MPVTAGELNAKSALEAAKVYTSLANMKLQAASLGVVKVEMGY